MGHETIGHRGIQKMLANWSRRKRVGKVTVEKVRKGQDKAAVMSWPFFSRSQGSLAICMVYSLLH